MKSFPGVTTALSVFFTSPMPHSIPPAGTAVAFSMWPTRTSASRTSPWSSCTDTTSTAAAVSVAVCTGLLSAEPPIMRGGPPMVMLATPGMLTFRPLGPNSVWVVISGMLDIRLPWASSTRTSGVSGVTFPGP